MCWLEQKFSYEIYYKEYFQDKEDVETWVELPDSDREPGVLPVQIRKLVERRREVSRAKYTSIK